MGFLYFIGVFLFGVNGLGSLLAAVGSDDTLIPFKYDYLLRGMMAVTGSLMLLLAWWCLKKLLALG